MPNEASQPRPTPQLGILLPVLAVIGLAVGAYLVTEACSADSGCVEGARDIWRAYLPDWLRKTLRSTVKFVLSPVALDPDGRRRRR